MINKNNINIGLFVLAFKPIDYNIPNRFTLLECGAALHNNHFSKCLDNTGDNISNRNRIYCDTTGAYWIWKNVHTPIKGQIQYRRFMNIEPNNIEDLLKYYDIICGNPLNFGQLSLEQQLNGLDSNYLKTIKQIISEKYPEYVSSYEKYIEHGSILYYSPGFITTDKIYDSICEFCFDILFEFMHRYGFENEDILYNHTKEWCLENNQEYGEGKLRVPGHLFERLFTLYIFHNNLKIMNTGPYILKEKNMTL